MLKQIVRLFQKKKEIKIVFLGASQAGKTTFIRYYETRDEVNEPTLSSVGIEYRKGVKLDNVIVTGIDIEGQAMGQKFFWSMGFSNADGVVYVIDGTIRKDMPEFSRTMDAFNRIVEILDDDKPILFCINKQDLPGCMTPEEAIRDIGITTDVLGPDCIFKVIKTSAKKGWGVIEGLMWLDEQI